MKSKSKRGEATRKKILAAASARIIKFGVNGTSVDDVLKDSLTGKSQFYHYFGSKDLMVRDLIEYRSTNMPWMSEELLSSFSTLKELESWLEQLSELYRAGPLAQGCPIGNLASELSANNEELRLALWAIFSRWSKALEASLARIAKGGEIHLSQGAECAAKFILEGIQGALVIAKASGERTGMSDLNTNIIRYLKSSSSVPRRAGASYRPAKAAPPRRSTQGKSKMGFCP